ncbi:hypothetical protein SeLEV6574_g05540 [Synchytrium endobioticum]|nr:hypothetical protein SeLEV6574_g05540 [Synchytrium endobioticum]
MLGEATRKIVEWTKTVQDPVMDAASQWMDLTVRILDGRMVQPQFKSVSERIDGMFEEVSKYYHPYYCSETLRDIVENLKGMWTTTKSKSGDDMSLALDNFFQNLDEVSQSIYKECGEESWNIKVALGECAWALKCRLSEWGSWEDPPECSECGEEVSVAERKKLSCNHFFHEHCLPKSGQPCARCSALKCQGDLAARYFL